MSWGRTGNESSQQNNVKHLRGNKVTLTPPPHHDPGHQLISA